MWVQLIRITLRGQTKAFNNKLVDITLRTFALEKIYLPRENLPEHTRGKFILGFIFPRWKGHTKENHI